MPTSMVIWQVSVCVVTSARRSASSVRHRRGCQPMDWRHIGDLARAGRHSADHVLFAFPRYPAPWFRLAGSAAVAGIALRRFGWVSDNGRVAARLLSRARVTARAGLRWCAVGMLMSGFGTRLGVDYVLALRPLSLRGGSLGSR